MNDVYIYIVKKSFCSDDHFETASPVDKRPSSSQAGGPWPVDVLSLLQSLTRGAGLCQAWCLEDILELKRFV